MPDGVTTLTLRQLLSEDCIDTLTNETLTPLVHKYILAVMNGKSQKDCDRVAFLIDHTCTYVRYKESVGLFEGTSCGLEDWHELAKLIRGKKDSDNV